MKALHQLTALAVVGILSPIAQADDCPFYNPKCWFRDAGKSAAEAAGKSAVEASENIYSAVNFWSKLVEDYHTGSPEEKAKARTLLKGVFGLTEIPNKEFAWEVRVAFRGIDTTTHPFRIAVLTNGSPVTQQALQDKISRGASMDLRFQPVIGKKPPTPKDPTAQLKDLAAIEAAVAGQLAAVEKNTAAACSEKLRAQRVSLGLDAGSGKVWQACLTDERPKVLARAIMAVADDRVDLRGDQLFVTVPWLGQRYITLVVPEIDLVAQPSLETEVTIHTKDKPDQVLPIFSKTAREVSRYRLASSFAYTSADPEHGGKYRAFTLEMSE